MAQCEGDLSTGDCGQCVTQAVQHVEVECGGAPSASPPLAKCIRGERGCIFASPFSSEGKKYRAMHDLLEELLEEGANMHSSLRETKMLLPRAVGVSLRLLVLLTKSITRLTRVPLCTAPTYACRYYGSYKIDKGLTI